MNARNISAMLLSCKEKANTRKLYVSSNLYCHGWTRGGTPGESGGGGWEGYRSQEGREEREEAIELKARSWESKVWEVRTLLVLKI